MLKPLLLLLVFCTCIACLNAQPGQLSIKGSTKNLYLEHTVAPKEGLFAIGRLYSIHPRHIAGYNKIDMNAGLAIGQTLRIPLTDTNFTQKINKGTPVYYTVSESEGLLKVSNSNNNVTMQKLREWNGLKNDNLTAGSKLIVGYLISTEMLAKGPAIQSPAQPVQNKLVVKAEPVKEKTETPAKVADKPVSKPVVPEQKALVKNDAPETKPKNSTPEEKTVANNSTIQERRLTKPELAASVETMTANPDQGYFKSSFDQQVKIYPAAINSTVTSGIFKTSSGWEDAKYYLLIDKVATGTIVKVMNPGNNKIVYAKVLGQMNGIRQNDGYDVRISNAAAATLGVAETDKFILKVNY